MGFPELKKVIHGPCTPPPSPKPRERLNLNVLQFSHTHSLFYSNLIEWNLHFEYFLSWNIVFPLLRLMNFTSKASKPFKSPKYLMYWLSGSVVILSQLKACVRYFLLLFFHQMIALQKLWKMFFISSKKLFSFSRYSKFCIFVFPSFFPCQPLL